MSDDNTEKYSTEENASTLESLETHSQQNEAVVKTDDIREENLNETENDTTENLGANGDEICTESDESEDCSSIEVGSTPSELEQDVQNVPNTRINQISNKMTDELSDPDESSEESSDDDDGDDEPEHEEHEDDYPPLFKYKRLISLPSRFFNSDPVSACHISQDIFFFATHSGILLICTPDYKPVKLFKAHTSSILSIDFDGEHFATASMDGTVLIGQIHRDAVTGEWIVNDNELLKYNFQRPMHCVAIHTPYSKTKSFFCGGTGGDVIYSSKNWLKQRSDTVVPGGDNGGCVTGIKSHDDFVVWCNDTGITVAQISTQKVLFKTNVPNGVTRPELYWPEVHFTEGSGILIGWIDTVWNLAIKNDGRGQKREMSGERNSVLSSAASSFRFMGDEKSVDLVYSHQFEECTIGGIAEHNGELLVLNYVSGYPPELKVFDTVSFEEISVDELPLRGYEGLSVNDYHLEMCSGADGRWFLVSANDAITVDACNVEDDVKWYTVKTLYGKAWKLAAGWMDPVERLKLGDTEVDKIFKLGAYDDAMKWLRRITFADSEEENIDTSHTWNKWLTKFHEAGILTRFSDALPKTPLNHGEIASEFYDLILHDLLKSENYELFGNFLEQWDNSLFDCKDVTLHIAEILGDVGDCDASDDITALRRMYISLSLRMNEPEDCVHQLVVLKDHNLMKFLWDHHLLESHFADLPKAVNFGDIDDNVKILVSARHEILPERIVRLFAKNELNFANYAFLAALQKSDGILIRDFEDEFVGLLTVYGKEEELANFLRTHRRYSIDLAMEVCEKNEKWRELVYLLGRIGEHERAVVLLVDKVGDPGEAVRYAQSIGGEVWDVLLDHALSKKDDGGGFVKELLLHTVNAGIDPVPVLSRVAEGVEIPGLKEILKSIIRGAWFDGKVYDLSREVVIEEYVTVSKRYRSVREKGYSVEDGELEKVRRSGGETFVRTQGKLLTEEELIGKKWEGGRAGNKVSHRSFIKYALERV